MPATLYRPAIAPQPVSDQGLWTPQEDLPFSGLADLVPDLLHCAPELVDVLASGQEYVVYTIFDCDGEINPEAMTAVGTLTGISFNTENEDEVLRGPVLVVVAGLN
jgi:hypothetical protein